MPMEAIGRLFDATNSPTTTATYVNMQDCSGLTVLLVGSSGVANATVTIAKDAAGTGAVTYTGADAAHGDGITKYLLKSSGVWTVNTQAAAATVPTTATASDITAFFIPATGLPDLYKYVKVSHATAQCVLVQHDLLVSRKPANLRNVTS